MNLQKHIRIKNLIKQRCLWNKKKSPRPGNVLNIFEKFGKIIFIFCVIFVKFVLND